MCEGKKSKSKRPNTGVLIARVATVALSVTTAVLIATASQCTVVDQYRYPIRTVTYRDYNSFMYLVIANILAAFSQTIAIFLKFSKKGKGGGRLQKALVDFLDVVVQGLLYSSTGSALQTDVACCRLPPSTAGQPVAVCGGASNFCGQVRQSRYLSVGAAVAMSSAVLAKHHRRVPLPRTSSGNGDSQTSSQPGTGNAGTGNVGSQTSSQQGTGNVGSQTSSQPYSELSTLTQPSGTWVPRTCISLIGSQQSCPSARALPSTLSRVIHDIICHSVLLGVIRPSGKVIYPNALSKVTRPFNDALIKPRESFWAFSKASMTTWICLFSK